MRTFVHLAAFLLVDWPADRRVCKASELGFSYSRLKRRFGAPFPGHAHQLLADKMLAPAEPEIEVIERW